MDGFLADTTDYPADTAEYTCHNVNGFLAGTTEYPTDTTEYVKYVTAFNQTQRNMLRNTICPILDGFSVDTTKYVQLWTTFQQTVHSIRQIPRSMSNDGFPADAKEYIQQSLRLYVKLWTDFQLILRRMFNYGQLSSRYYGVSQIQSALQQMLRGISRYHGVSQILDGFAADATRHQQILQSKSKSSRLCSRCYEASADTAE